MFKRFLVLKLTYLQYSIQKQIDKIILLLKKQKDIFTFLLIINKMTY